MDKGPNDDENSNCIHEVFANVDQDVIKQTWLVFLVHGYKGGEKTLWLKDLQNSILERYATTIRRVVVGIVYWSYGAQELAIDPLEENLGFSLDPCSVPILLNSYKQAASNSMVVGHLIGKLTQHMVTVAPYDISTFCIGHSLGAHVCGFAGKSFRLSPNDPTSPLMDGIIGLDPARPIFEHEETSIYTPLKNKLYKFDAKVVHVIHTNAKQFGYWRPIGDIGFYVNDAMTQPECPGGLLDTCSHTFVYKLLISLNIKASSSTCLSTVRCDAHTNLPSKFSAYNIYESSCDLSELVEVGNLEKMVPHDENTKHVIQWLDTTSDKMCSYSVNKPCDNIHVSEVREGERSSVSGSSSNLAQHWKNIGTLTDHYVPDIRLDISMIEITYKKLYGLNTNGWSVYSLIREAPAIEEIRGIIDYVRRTIDYKEAKGTDMQFYIGRASYEVDNQHSQEYPPQSIYINKRRIGALADRFDNRKIEDFFRYKKDERKIEIKAIYDTVMQSAGDETPTDRYIRTHATMEAILIHLFCDYPAQADHKEYFPVGTHYSYTSTTIPNILQGMEQSTMAFYRNKYACHCTNSVAGTVNGGKNDLSGRNRGLVYFVGINDRSLGDTVSSDMDIEWTTAWCNADCGGGCRVFDDTTSCCQPCCPGATIC